ncbi:helix-turn-helix transcriptional regulator [Muricauda sp. CAU 1633]|uniref:helix-turn-helix domain-containing protein n=1 Tax=Allomuricauda sp. CAU 1633 TaxID=2816036 RepID=UPI001A8FA281|nr:helix-turn-helix transcriptional regulator [Muricauda sp. CAU 1633]MBO0323304.1 helix-turn-helix transcriptional regulator [Muricauda sp. CAU 1633]
MDKGIVTRIKTIIDHYALSVSAFADTIGVQRSSISHLLNGRNKPSLDFVLKLVEAYPEVDLYWLLQGKGEFPAEESAESKVDIEKDSPTLTFEDIPNKPQEKNQQSKTLKPIHIIHEDAPNKIVFFYPDGTFTTFKSKND